MLQMNLIIFSQFYDTFFKKTFLKYVSAAVAMQQSAVQG